MARSLFAAKTNNTSKKLLAEVETCFFPDRPGT